MTLQAVAQSLIITMPRVAIEAGGDNVVAAMALDTAQLLKMLGRT